MSEHLPEQWKAAWAANMPPPGYASHGRSYEDRVDEFVSAYDAYHLQATQPSAVESLASQMMDMQYSTATGAEEEEEEAQPAERSASAPALRSSIDTLLQGNGSSEDEHVFMQRQPSSATKPLARRERQAVPVARGGRPRCNAESSRRAPNLGVSRAHGHSIAKRPNGRRPNSNDPHERARQADLAAARYSVTTWEDVQRFRLQAASTKARHDAWEAKPIAWDLVLAGSFSSMAAG